MLFFGCLRGMQRGTTLAEIRPCWQLIHLSSTFFMVLERFKDSQCSRSLGSQVVQQASGSHSRLNAPTW